MFKTQFTELFFLILSLWFIELIESNPAEEVIYTPNAVSLSRLNFHQNTGSWTRTQDPEIAHGKVGSLLQCVSLAGRLGARDVVYMAGKLPLSR